MLVLLQMIAMAQSRRELKRFIDSLYAEFTAGAMDTTEMVERLGDFTNIELTTTQIEMLAKVLGNGSYESAFRLAEMKANEE